VGDVASFVPVGARRGVARERTSIEECVAHAGLAVRIANDIRARAVIAYGATAIVVRRVVEGIGHSKPVAGGSRDNSGELPVPDELVCESVGIPAKRLSSTEGQIPGVAGDEVMADVEVGVAVLQLRKALVAEVPIGERSELALEALSSEWL